MTLNLAHRGARLDAPENTLPAFLRAMELGADGVELDVQLSADGALFVLHDILLESTTSGHGAASRLTLAALKELDAGSHFGPDWAGTRIPTLDEVFDALPDDAFVNIELKRYTVRSDGLEEVARAFITRRGLHDRVIVSSFNPIILHRLRDAPFPIGLLYAPELPPGLSRGEARHFLRPDALHPHHSQVRRPLPTLPVNCWTVNESRDMTRLLDLGVAAIITDVPGRLAAIQQARAEEP